ncbi:DUF2167 domain-containing protein [Novosphingobium sp.]|uniref:DUF2167 domain-containing protein n=1 Tax=Novosphingobium sp. TaxID=1874826 RepID=UPI0035B2F748
MARMKLAGIGLALALAIAPMPLVAQDNGGQADVAALVKTLKPQHGKIALPEARATLDLGTAYDFYGPEDARTILVTIWGNPPDSAEGVLGLVMQAGKSPLQDNWGAVVTYEATGYVSDEDAASTDYAELMKQMQESEVEVNKQRQAGGYPAIHLTGWAEPPNYDSGSHSVVWAQELAFADTNVHSLNYDVRTLGRGGVLSVNLISSMPHLAEVKAAAHEFAGHASFDAGARYADFDPNLDKKAEYGIGGLVAAGVGVAAAKKLGLLAIFAKFLKPLLVAVVVAFGALRNRIMGLFGRGRDELEG